MLKLPAFDAAPPRPAPAAAMPPAGPNGTPSRRDRTAYLRLLAWAFALFNSARVVAYLPTIWAIWASGDSQQHSWFTWLTWAGANATMAAWLYEEGDHRMSRAVAVNLCNAVMCAATLVLIVAFRF